MKLHAYEHHGPCINGRIETLSESIDPLGVGLTSNWQTEKLVFDAVGFEAQAYIYSGGELLREGNEHHDWKGFGDSIENAIEDAKKWHERLGENVTAKVTARLVSQPAIFVEHPREATPFYIGAVKVFYALPRWGFYWENGKTVEVCDLAKKVTEYTAWENGSNGGDWEELQRLVQEIPPQDIAADRRRKSVTN